QAIEKDPKIERSFEIHEGEFTVIDRGSGEARGFTVDDQALILDPDSCALDAVGRFEHAESGFARLYVNRRPEFDRSSPNVKFLITVLDGEIGVTGV
ncbi:hypothetical protein CR082_25545, partial [Salmonella enterica subsp. enterica serovar Typhimurium]